MIYEIVLFTAWFVCSTLVVAACFYLGRFIARKVEKFFDRRH